MSQCQRIVTALRKKPCPNDSHDYPLCFECIKTLGQIIHDLKEFAGELEIQITRQDRGAPTVGAGSGEPRMAFDLDASQVRDGVEVSLAHWFAETTDVVAHQQLQGRTIQSRIRYLLAWYGQFYVHLGRSELGPRILADLDEALRRAMRACDRKQDKVWIGNCCGKAVLAYPHQQTNVQCEECETEYDPAVSRRSLRIEGGNQYVTIKQARALGEVWGRKFNINTIKSWHRRGKIQCQNPDCAKGCEHTYRMSDLLTLHKEN